MARATQTAFSCFYTTSERYFVARSVRKQPQQYQWLVILPLNPMESGQPYVDGVEWLVLNDDSTALALYRTGQLDLLGVRQEDVEALKKSHPHLMYQDVLGTATLALWMRTDQPPFTDVRVRRA